MVLSAVSPELMHAVCQNRSAGFLALAQDAGACGGFPCGPHPPFAHLPPQAGEGSDVGLKLLQRRQPIAFSRMWEKVARSAG
ncbi:hypothetical protein XcodCFBP4690_11450 [Xanthomonas codiaei]|uniref:Uncharacterized protein n=1 Tax=Xanthomonas codiaei TaxID=56463 RepID=A0A2S7CQ98_9XANT|nr:hypothetical protein XcodCFBP4690_11450 [Xanthomonas codiaei]